jgi:zinc protease
MKSTKFLICAALTCVAAPLAAEAPIPADFTLAPDPAVRSGTLLNGMRWSVMHNATPAKAVSIRLAMDVGSYQEEEKERGFAHYIEHMTFRSTRDAPEGSLDTRFAKYGIALGRDQNAATSLLSTVYRVDLPSNGSEGVRAILAWMRGAADGVLFTPKAVDMERGVVLAEKEARNSPTAEMQLAVARFQGAGLRSGNREPIGTEESLRGATAAGLQAFYDRWYRPENATLIIVGDAPVEELERLAKEYFADWKGRGPAGTQPAPPPLPKRGPDALTVSSAVLPTATGACRMSPSARDRSPSLERLRRDIYSALWPQILNKRLGYAVSAAGSPLLGASVSVSRELPDAAVACLTVLPVQSKWKEGLDAGHAELRRFAAAGPTGTETSDAIEMIRSRLRAQLYQGSTRNSGLLAELLTDSVLSGRVMQSPEETMRTFDTVMAGVTAADVKRAFERDWAGNGPLMVAVAPKAPAKEALLAAWTSNESAAPLAAYADRAQSQWLYSDFGPLGTVKSRETIADPGFVRLTFANGTVLNFRRTDFEASAAEIRLRFGQGERNLAKSDRFKYSLAAELFPSGGLRRMDVDQIGSAFTNSTWGFSLDVEADAYTIASSTLAVQVPGELQLLAAYMTDPGFGRLIDDKLPTSLDLYYRIAATDPNAVAALAFEKAVFPDQLSMPPLAEVQGLRARDFDRMLRPVLLQSPVEVTIIGDIAEEDAVRAVAASFGALPARKPLATPAGRGPYRRFPAKLPGEVDAFHSGPADKAAALMVWPLYTASSARRHEEYAISLLSTVFQNRLLQRLRVEMGKTYSPAIENRMIDNADQGYLAASVETAPADIDAVVKAARAVAAELAAGQIDQQEVDAAREPAIAARVQARSSNSAWAGVVSQSIRHPEALDELFRYDEQLKAVSLADVRKAASTWLSHAPMVSTARPRPSGTVASRR